MLEIKGLCVAVDVKTVVDGVSLTVRPGQVCCRWRAER